MRKRNPKITITGKTRIKPLSLTQLEALLETTRRGRDKDKIINRMKILKGKQK